ncbi:MAG: S8 family serine peptidase [Candidatus Hodarchaeales archaeon]
MSTSREIIFALAALLPLILALIFLFNSQALQFTLDQQLWEDQVDIQGTPIVILPSSQDRDDDKLSDSLEEKLAGNQVNMIDVLIGYDHEPSIDDRQELERLGGIWKRSFKIVWIISAMIPVEKLPLLADQHHVTAIEENAKSNAHLYYSSTQIRARNGAWNILTGGSSGDNHTGVASFSTAVLDTGVDNNHPDLASRCIAWYDFAGVNASVEGDEYVTYSDFGHHGTHVASIIAGQGNASMNGYVNVTESGTIVTTENNLWYGQGIELTSNDQVVVNISHYWKDTNTTWAGIYNGSLVDDNWLNNDNDGEWSYTIPLNAAGNYTAMIGGNNGDTNATNRPYVSQTSIPLSTSTDSYGLSAGIAPNSKIVALKVLDDTGWGTTDLLLAAYDWCVANRAVYNITVISMSLGFDNIYASIDTATSNLVNDHGFVVLASAGNNGPTATQINSPGSTPVIITVGATNRYNEVAYYSSNGNSTVNNVVEKPDVIAPGGSIRNYPFSSVNYSFKIVAADSNYDDDWIAENSSDYWVDGKITSDHYPDDYRGMQGTSMSTPHVSGLAQLVIQRLTVINNGNWTWKGSNARLVKQIISMATSESAAMLLGGEQDYQGTWQEPTLNRGQKDYVEGWGRVDAKTAVEIIESYKVTEMTESISFSDSVNGQRVVGYRLNLTAGYQYNYSLNVTQNDDDLDLFLYDGNSDSNGEPVQVASSKNETLGKDEEIIYTAAKTSDYFLVIRWSNGTGAALAEFKFVNITALTEITVLIGVTLGFVLTIALISRKKDQ